MKSSHHNSTTNINPGDQLFARFEVIELISKRLGIWKVRDLNTTKLRLIALCSKKAEDGEIFLQTGKRFQDLSVPALPQVLEILVDHQSIGLIMKGGELSPISMEKPLHYKDLLKKCSQLIQSLDLLNANGITHGSVENSLTLSNASGFLFILPPLFPISTHDDVVGLGRFFLKMLTTGKASVDVSEPNHCNEFLWEKQLVPPAINQLVGDMLAGRMPGMRYVVQRIREIESLEKSPWTSSKKDSAVSHSQSSDSRPQKRKIAVWAFLLVFFGIACGVLWIRWSQIRLEDNRYNKDSTTMLSEQSFPADPLGILKNGDSNVARTGREANKPGPTGHQASQPPVSPELLTSKSNLEIEVVLGKWLRALRELENVGSQEWAPEELKKILALAKKGEDALLNQDLLKAEEYYQNATNLAMRLFRSRVHKLSHLIMKGNAALEEKNSVDAIESFRLALLIDSKNKDAVRGSRRAKTLDQVNSLVENAHMNEQAGNFGIARTLFLEAYDLDQDNTDSLDGVKRMDAALGEVAFRERITMIFHDLESGNLEGAQERFNEAAVFKPDSLTIRETRKIIDHARQQHMVEFLKEKAAVYQEKEDWQQAHAMFTEMLKWIPHSREAKDGKRKAEKILKLQTQLFAFVHKPEALLRHETRANARMTLQKIEKLEGIPNNLQTAVSELKSMLTAAESSISVTLISDGETEVTIYPYGELGKFKMLELSLRPGSYTVVGIRKGYRDVRSTLNIKPGQDKSSVMVRCKESIF